LVGHISPRNCFPEHFIERKIEGRIELTVRRCKQLLDALKETKVYWKSKEEALARSLWELEEAVDLS
jgi:hypothetical protein